MLATSTGGAKRRTGDRVLAARLLAAGLVAASALGCAVRERVVYVEYYGTGVELPEGFRPLPGHTDPHNPADFYDGRWPRFILSEADDMVMVYVPTQTIIMGGGLGADEVPARQVRVNHFYMDLHEVSNFQYDCVRRQAGRYRHRCDPLGICGGGRSLYRYEPDWLDTEARAPRVCLYTWGLLDARPRDIQAFRRYWTPGVNDSHPVRNVSWREAWYYSRWTGKMLPSEAQWEAAARGTDQRIYPWGNQEFTEVTIYLANYRTGVGDFDGYEYTAPVLSYAAGVSPHGLYNMAGNVWEWCGDWYDPGRHAYPSIEDPATGLERGPKPFGDRYYPNPWDKHIAESRVGPMRGDQRAMRGGSFTDPLVRCRVDSRAAAGPDVRQHNVGFRTILPLPPQT